MEDSSEASLKSSTILSTPQLSSSVESNACGTNEHESPESEPVDPRVQVSAPIKGSAIPQMALSNLSMNF